MQTYSQAVQYLERFLHYERKPPVRRDNKTFNLESFRSLLEDLGNPQEKFQVIHVAGTKGKGSTCAMIASILRAEKFRVGLYTSPHLVSYRERITVNGKWIRPACFVRQVDRIRQVIEHRTRAADDEFRTVFEILTAAAFLEFADRRVDIAVVETGLGGTLDATNVVRPVVAVCTAMSLDHTELLGKTVTKIARDKAGIIKPGCTAILAPQPTAARKALLQRCREKGVEVIAFNKDWKLDGVQTSLKGTQWNLRSSRGQWKNLFCPLPGLYQAENGSLAVLAVQVWAMRTGKSISSRAIRQGLSRVQWKGRLQIWRPGILLDGAHNVASALRLSEAMQALFRAKRKAWLVFGASSDKDVAGMLKVLAPISEGIVLTQAAVPRAMPVAALARLARKIISRQALICEADPVHAVRLARSRVQDGQSVLVTGSLFLVGEILRESNGHA